MKEACMPNVQIRVDENLRTRAQNAIFPPLRMTQAEWWLRGLDLSTAVRMFLTQMVRENGLPFRPSADPFFSAANQEHLEKVVADLKASTRCSAHNLIED